MGPQMHFSVCCSPPNTVAVGGVRLLPSYSGPGEGKKGSTKAASVTDSLAPFPHLIAAGPCSSSIATSKSIKAPAAISNKKVVPQVHKPDSLHLPYPPYHGGVTKDQGKPDTTRTLTTLRYVASSKTNATPSLPGPQRCK